MLKDDSRSAFQRLIIAGAALPASIFSVTFDKYLFFDVDLCSSEPLINLIQEVISNNFEEGDDALVFSVLDGNLLGKLGVGEIWVNKIKALVKDMRASGDHHGIALIGVSGEWVAYQARPVDDGVFAFNCKSELLSLAVRLQQYFFDRSIVCAWSSNESMRGKSVNEGFGREYLSMLLENFHDRVLWGLESLQATPNVNR